MYFSEYMPTYSPVFLFYNTTLFLLLTLLGGGRYDWAYEWGGVLLGLNALPFFYRLIKHRGRLLGRGPLFWLLGILLPWITFGGLFYAAQYNPSHELLFPNNLFSPLIPLEHVTLLPTTPNPERSRLFLIFLLGLLCLPLNILTAPIKRKTIRSCMGLIVITAALLAISGAVMKLTGNPKLLGIIELREPIAFGSFFYKNHWAYFALLAAGCGMGLFHSIYARERATGHFPEKSVGIALLVLILLISIPLAEARAASIVAAPLALAFLLSIFAPIRRRYPRRFILLCALSFCGSSIMLYTVAKPQLDRSIERTEHQIESVEAADYTTVKRLALYRDSWRMIQEKPLWGWGFGSFIHIHPIYAGDEFYKPGFDYPVAYEFAHSDPIQCLVEFGIFGSCFLLFPLTVLYQVINSGRTKQISDKLLEIACCLILLASAVDMVFTSPSISTGLFICLCSILRNKQNL